MLEHPPIGWREWIALPDLGIAHLKVKIDTGARTSALHAEEVEIETRAGGTEWARFLVRPYRHEQDVVFRCEGEVVEYRKVTDSGGHRSRRPFVKTRAMLGETEWTIYLSLTTRADMIFPMLLGRTAMAGVFQVDPARSYTRGRHHLHPREAAANEEIADSP